MRDAASLKPPSSSNPAFTKISTVLSSPGASRNSKLDPTPRSRPLRSRSPPPHRRPAPRPGETHSRLPIKSTAPAPSKKPAIKSKPSPLGSAASHPRGDPFRDFPYYYCCRVDQEGRNNTHDRSQQFPARPHRFSLRWCSSSALIGLVRASDSASLPTLKLCLGPVSNSLASVRSAMAAPHRR